MRFCRLWELRRWWKNTEKPKDGNTHKLLTRNEKLQIYTVKVMLIDHKFYNSIVLLWWDYIRKKNQELPYKQLLLDLVLGVIFLIERAFGIKIHNNIFFQNFWPYKVKKWKIRNRTHNAFSLCTYNTVWLSLRIGNVDWWE